MLAKFILSLLGRAVPLALALVGVSQFPKSYQRNIAYGLALLIYVVVDYFGTLRPLKNLEDKQKELLDLFFARFVGSAEIEHQKATIRVNVMLVKWCIGWWPPIRREFLQFYQKGMEGHPDCNAHFRIKAGFCGQAFNSRYARAHYVDLRLQSTEDKKQYRLTPALQQQTSIVKAIVCVPLYRKMKTMRGNASYKWVGVLNIDATDDAGADLLREPKIQEQIEGFASFVQAIVA